MSLELQELTSVELAVGQQLAATPGLVLRLKTDTLRGIATTYNVLAESVDGNPDNVIMAGAHLDSVNAGPGIQDNGSGSAAILEVALQMAKVKPVNKVRFACGKEDPAWSAPPTMNNLSQEEKDKITSTRTSTDRPAEPRLLHLRGDNSTLLVLALDRRLRPDWKVFEVFYNKVYTLHEHQRAIGLRPLHRCGHPCRRPVHRRGGHQDCG
jgi:hypothetical protein